MADFSSFKLTYADAKSKIDTYDTMIDVEFADQVRHWAVYDVPEETYSDFYKSIRVDIVNTFKDSLENQSYRINYYLDLMVGIRLYELLNPKNGFTIVQANDDDIWRYISICVFPDITFIRYPNQISDVDTLKESLPGLSYAGGIKTEQDGVRMKKKRFYSHTRRIWLKTLWWYIHLGWQGDSKKTYEVLKNNGTNIISHFIERPGKGYRPVLFRSMLYAYYLLPEQKDKTFRAAAKMNLAKCINIEPAFTLGGEQQYSVDLFNEVTEKEHKGSNA